MLIAEKGELWVSLVQMLQDHPDTHASPGDVNVRSAMLRALRRWPIAFCARVSTEKIKNQLNQLYTFRSLHSKHADINITNPLTLTCKANIVTCWIRLGQVRTLMRNAMFFHEVLQLKSCLLSHKSSAGRSKLCCVRAVFTKKHKHMLLTMNVMSGNSTVRVFAFSWSFLHIKMRGYVFGSLVFKTL